MKSGALSPGFSFGPTSVTGLPRNVTSPLRVFCHGCLSSWIQTGTKGVDSPKLISLSAVDGARLEVSGDVKATASLWARKRRHLLVKSRRRFGSNDQEARQTRGLARAMETRAH